MHRLGTLDGRPQHSFLGRALTDEKFLRQQRHSPFPDTSLGLHGNLRFVVMIELRRLLALPPQVPLEALIGELF